MSEWITYEFQILDFIHEHLACRFLDVVIPILTSLGNAGICWFLAAFALICTKKYRANGIVMILSILAGALIGNLTLKPLVARARPSWICNVPLLIANPTDYSFPSGHTLSSTIGAVCLTCTNRKFAAVAIPFAILMAFTRLYLYVHFPTDVLAGAALGVVIAFFMQKLVPTFDRLSKGLPQKK